MEFFKPLNLKIINTNDSFILTKGFLHQSSLTIDKINSTKEFVFAFEEFIKNGSIDIKENSELADDFNKLVQFDLIRKSVIEDEYTEFKVIISDCAYKFYKENCPANVEVIKNSELLNEEEIRILYEDSNQNSIESIRNHYSKRFKNSQVFIILPMSNYVTIKAYNKLFKHLGQRFYLGFFDNNNVFFTCINHGETGCFECLEHQIISRFSGTIEDYEDTEELEFEMGMYTLLFSFVSNEFKNLTLYTDTTLQGNVLHFYLPTYEYNFNFNKRQTSCTTCATLNNILFSEQNLKSINILERILGND